MRDFWELFSSILFIVAIAAILVFVAVRIIYACQTNNWEYKDLDGNIGYSTLCYVSRGGSFCEKNGGAVQVKEFIIKEAK